MSPSPTCLPSLPDGYRAVVIGASGAIGQAFVQRLGRDPRCGEVVAVSRHAPIPWDLRDEPSIARLAAGLPDGLHLVVDATGALTLPEGAPEKRLQDLDPVALQAAFQVNAIGPALLVKHLHPRLARQQRVIWAKLSARVGSIGDNRKGGWYGYRASKAALNQLCQTAAIELARARPLSVMALLQPGTVQSRLSAPFVGSAARPPEEAAEQILRVLDGLPATGRAHFVDAAGLPVPW